MLILFQTEYGPFDGDSWEAFCQKCLKIRHIKEGYIPMPAHFNGDLGIEGFTREGIVYQCYCPDENYGPKDLYEHQRDKIRDDLKKLIKYKNEHLKFKVPVTTRIPSKDFDKFWVVTGTDLRMNLM